MLPGYPNQAEQPRASHESIEGVECSRTWSCFYDIVAQQLLARAHSLKVLLTLRRAHGTTDKLQLPEVLYEDVNNTARHISSIPVIDPKTNGIGLTIMCDVAPLAKASRVRQACRCSNLEQVEENKHERHGQHAVGGAESQNLVSNGLSRVSPHDSCSCPSGCLKQPFALL